MHSRLAAPRPTPRPRRRAAAPSTYRAPALVRLKPGFLDRLAWIFGFR